MKTILLILALSLTLSAATSAEDNPVSETILYVSPAGDDRWSGSLPEPRAGGTDGPLATFEAARDAARQARKGNPAPVTILIRGGSYVRSQSLQLDYLDSSGVWKPYGNETVRVSGGKRITGFVPVSDREVLARLEPPARGSVLQVDLRSHGITDYGNLTPRGFGRPMQPAALELFFNGRPMHLARWPNGEWTKIADVPAGPKEGKFTYQGDRPRRWAGSDDVWIHGYWFWDWADSYEKVASIDTASGEIATVPPHSIYGYKAGQRFYAMNILEELDQAGEWYLDRSSGILYFWPPAPVEGAEVAVSLLDQPFVVMDGTSEVRFEGITFECSRASGIVINGGSGNRVVDCVLRNLGTIAVSIGEMRPDYQNDVYRNPTLDRRGGSGNGVVGCTIYQTGEGAVTLGGGNRKSLTPGGNIVSDCEIYDFSRWVPTYRPAVAVDGVGNIVSHNLMHHAPHSAIIAHGNDHVVEYNEIHHVCLETNDAGAFYIGRDFTERGNKIRFNYFHDLGTAPWVHAVYLDDCASGTLVLGNIFFRAGAAVFIGGGRDNHVENNIFVRCRPGMRVDARGLGWASFWFDGRDPTLMNRLEAVNHDEPPYSSRYLGLKNILDDEPAVPKGNRLVRNICYAGGCIELNFKEGEQVVSRIANWQDADPGFVSPSLQGLDSDPQAPEKAPGAAEFRLRPDAPAHGTGFRPLPVDRIGPRK